MCKYCSTEEGNCEQIINGTGMEDIVYADLTMSNNETNWTLDVSSWIVDRSLINISVEINYCPFCGRKLH